ncbi:MAG: cobalamin B12-binding domain-containing protein [Desulfarculus sp.]|nr:cobalamin B12-binding domain-containing protein [Desulfarculus sp.]
MATDVRQSAPPRVLVAKPGLDGHDRGAKVVAYALREGGMEVIYGGLHQTTEQILHTALQEAVDVIGLSIMSGAHLPICRRLMRGLTEQGLSQIKVVVGGVIPQPDILRLLELGVAAVFPGGTPLPEIVEGVRRVARAAQEA